MIKVTHNLLCQFIFNFIDINLFVTSDATATFTLLVEYDDMQERYVKLVSSVAGREVSPDQTDQHVVAYDDVQSSSPAGPLIVRFIHVESAVGTYVEGRSKEVSMVPVTQVWPQRVLFRQHRKTFTVIREFSKT